MASQATSESEVQPSGRSHKQVGDIAQPAKGLELKVEIGLDPSISRYEDSVRSPLPSCPAVEPFPA